MVGTLSYTIMFQIDDEEFNLVLKHLNSVVDDVLGFDTENLENGKIKFIQIYSPIARKSFIFDTEDERIKKIFDVWHKWNIVGHNLMHDLALCKNQFGSYPNPIADTYLIACSLQEENKALKTLCNQYLGTKEEKWEDLFGNYDYNMTPEKWQYVANDPCLTYKLYKHYCHNGAYKFIEKAHQIDMKALIHYMESARVGIFIDMDEFNKSLSQYSEQVGRLQTKLNEYAGWSVNTSSTKNVKKLLFEQMNLTIPPITTESGDVSVSKEALSYVEDKDGIVSLILQIKESKSVLSAMNNL